MTTSNTLIGKTKTQTFFEHLNFFYDYLKVNPMREV